MKLKIFLNEDDILFMEKQQSALASLYERFIDMNSLEDESIDPVEVMADKATIERLMDADREKYPTESVGVMLQWMNLGPKGIESDQPVLILPIELIDWKRINRDYEYLHQ